MASLTVIKGPDQGKRFEVVGDNLNLGRDARSSIRLRDSEISRHHLELRRTPRGYLLIDLHSSNGTFVNNERVENVALKTGDRVRVGQSEMIFSDEASSRVEGNDLIRRINMISNPSKADSSAIVRSIKHSEGSQILRHPETAGSEWLKDALSSLAVMYETSQAISEITDIDRLLERIMDLVFRSIRADRGCIMLKDAEIGELQPSAIRHGGETPSNEPMALSRTIIDWVLTRNEGMLVVDATQDERVSAAQSVVQMGIREVICVPLRGRHETFGVMYVDVKSDRRQLLVTQQPTILNEDHLKLMMAIAYQAGLAIEDSRYYSAMMQAERLAAIGQTIATLSHHIKNILQGLRSGSYLIELGLKEQKLDLIQQGWGVVQKNQDKIYNLVMDMLSYSKEREPALDMTDLNRVAADVVELMAPRATEFGVVLESVLDNGLPRIAVDEEGIHRALLNVVTNAIDAVEGRNEARVIVQTESIEEGRKLSISVHDNGIGIPESQVARIFHIFNTTKGAKGSGLGLAVSKKIVEEHGGRIHVTSQIDKGSTFAIELPFRTLEGGGGDGMTTRLDLDVSQWTNPAPEEPPE